MNRRPRGFAVLAVCAAIAASMPLSAVAGGQLAADVRLMLLVWGAAAAVAAEALWRARPWASRAVAALAIGAVGGVVLVGATYLAAGRWDAAVILALVSFMCGVGLYPVLTHVRDASRAPTAVNAPRP